MRHEPRRKTPEELLRQCQAEEAAVAKRGHLKIVLGYASGVGKSFRMFDEARRRHDRGQDVVVAALQPTMPPEVAEIVSGLESISARFIEGVPVIDTDAVLSRRPKLCVVDGL